VDVTPRTCKLPTAPYAIDTVRTIIENLISFVLNMLGRGYLNPQASQADVA
jgi:hypothetical protein